MIRSSSNRRPAVGIMTGSFHTEYSRRIANSLCRALREDEIDVYLFQGLDASRFLNLGSYVDKGFDRHYYSQYEYSRFVPLDCLILSFGTISAVQNAMPLEELLAALPRVPVVLLEDETDIPNGLHITVDNYVGMFSCVEHLICEHGCKKPLYLSGPQGVEDSEIRLSAYRRAMELHGIPLSEDMIAYGDFTDGVDNLVRALLDRWPTADAIISANDEMAESVYRVLFQRGLVPGRDIAVTGFDNNPSSRYMGPPLTTVQQDYDEVSERAAAAVRALLRGERPESVHLPARLVVRESCGCPACAPETTMHPVDDGPSTIMRYRLRNKQLVQDNMLSALMLRNLLQEDVTVHSFFRSLGGLLHQLGTEHAWIGLLPQPLTVEGGKRVFLPGALRVHMVLSQGQVSAYSRIQAPVIQMDSPVNVPLWDCAGDHPTAVFPLFYGSVHYGVMAVALRHEQMLFHYALSLEIGTGLRYLFMALDQQEAKLELEEQNRILDYSAIHDALTGLLNRAGIMRNAMAFIQKQAQDARFVAVMADLDHLKQINDTFGHATGDRAIRAASELLRSTLPPGSPIGRSGGDEFSAIFLQRDGHDAAWFRRAIREACGQFNDSSEEPFFVGISVGCVSFSWDQFGNLPDLMKQADQVLYEDKMQRRTNVIRTI